MTETRLLYNALALARYQSFAQAAKSLGISQPTLTRSIQLLEKNVGEQLFDRTSRTILPTKAGEIMLKHARIITASSVAMREEIEQQQGLMKGALYIGSGPFAATELLAPAIDRFSRYYPDIEIDVRVDDWRIFADRLMHEDFDYVIMESSELNNSRELELFRLNHHQGFFYCRKNHPMLEKDNLSIREMAQFSLIAPALPVRLTGMLSSLFFPDRHTAEAKNNLQKYTCNDLGTIKATVAGSDLISIGTHGILAPELESGIFEALPFRIPGLNTDHHIVKRKALSLSPAARVFLDLLIEIDQEQFVSEFGLIESLDTI